MSQSVKTAELFDKCNESGFLQSFSRTLARLLEEFFLCQPEGDAHGHLCNETLAGRLRHLLTEAQVDLTDAAAALEEREGVVRYPITH